MPSLSVVTGSWTDALSLLILDVGVIALLGMLSLTI